MLLKELKRLNVEVLDLPANRSVSFNLFNLFNPFNNIQLFQLSTTFNPFNFKQLQLFSTKFNKFMKAFFSSLKPSALLLTFGMLLFSITSTMQSCSPGFDQIGLDNVTNLGGQLTQLMGKATEPFGKHSASVEKLLGELGNAATHAAGQKGNKEIAASWNVLNNELAKPFFDRWKEKGVLDKDFVKESVGQVGKSIDAIKKAEMAKKK